jgi:hypothetical protein
MKQLVLDYFIPPEIVEMLNRKAQWDETSDAVSFFFFLEIFLFWNELFPGPSPTKHLFPFSLTLLLIFFFYSHFLRHPAMKWIIPRKNLVGNGMRGARRPVSATGLRRPETDYAKHRKKFSSNPRYRADNITNFELDQPERTTADYEGAAKQNFFSVFVYSYFFVSFQSLIIFLSFPSSFLVV